MMESKALALGKQVKAEALNSDVHQAETNFILHHQFANYWHY
jgi:hypothetical protein